MTSAMTGLELSKLTVAASRRSELLTCPALHEITQLRTRPATGQL